jgi:membrane-associated phospholipid phosphatase
MPVVIGGLVLSFLTLLLFGGSELDRLLLGIAALGEAGLARPASWLGMAAAPVPLLALALVAALWLALRSRWYDALFLLTLVLLGQLLVEAVQTLTVGLRPAFDPSSPAGLGSRYPSPHAANATLTAFGIAFIATSRFPARALALAGAALFSVSAGLARLVIGGNWPSDVIGGWALGLAWTLLLLRIAGTDLGDGTARTVRHSFTKEKIMSENPRTETARRTDDKELIEDPEPAPAFGSASGGQLQRDIGSRAEMKHEEMGGDGVERVRDSDKSEGENLPRFNEK